MNRRAIAAVNKVIASRGFATRSARASPRYGPQDQFRPRRQVIMDSTIVRYPFPVPDH
jgi:hypothetical protein